jgi:hypothetical protein
MPLSSRGHGRARAASLAIATLAAGLALVGAGPAAPSVAGSTSTRPLATSSVKVVRGKADREVAFYRGRAGEALLTTSVSAPGVDWSQAGNESAVVSVYVDKHYATDVVITSAAPVQRQFALGYLRRGHHTLRFHYATSRSPSDQGVARLSALRVRTVTATSPSYAAVRNAPVLYGRNVAFYGDKFQNNHTDTPLIAWHQVLPAATPGHHVIEYTVVWSNEDGGTSTGQLMAQWGRTTDIEWVYRVEVDARGRRVPGTGVIQAAGHATSPFTGTYDGTHPRIETCTGNNNVCSAVDDPMRFALSTREFLPAGQPREYEMDRHPWTYQVMAREMVREGKLESPADPATPQPSDQRDYLYVAVDHDTDPAGSAAGIGLVVDVQLVGDPTTYSSNHGIPQWIVNRNGPAATTVELPPGTTAADIASISVTRVPLFSSDNGAVLTVTRLRRAFLLGPDYLPQGSIASWTGSVTLTADSPSAILWSAS